MSVEVIQSSCAFQQQQQQPPGSNKQKNDGGSAAANKQMLSSMSPKHYVLEGSSKNDKLLQQIVAEGMGMGVHTRHASVPDSLLHLKGSSAMNASADLNGWSPAHERFSAGNAGNAAAAAAAAAAQKADSKPVKAQSNTSSSSSRIKQQNGASKQSTGSRTTDEESGDYDSSLDNTSVSSFDFNRERAAAQAAANAAAAAAATNGGPGAGGRSSHPGKSGSGVPSKWDDAEKWLINSADAAAMRGSKPRMQQLLSTIPTHVIVNASKKAALLGQQQQQQARASLNAKLSMEVMHLSNADLNVDADHMTCTKKIVDSAGGPYKFSFMPSPASLAPHSKARSMSSLDRYPLEELLTTCDTSKLKLVTLSSDDAPDDDMDCSKPALRTEKPTSDFPTADGHDLSKGDSGGGGGGGRNESGSYVTPAGLRSVSMRDMGTEMTPIASQEPSRTGTPLRATTPTIRSPVSSRPSTPGRLVAPSGNTNSNSEAATPPPDLASSGSGSQTPGQHQAQQQAQGELSEKQLQAKTRQEILALGTQLGKANIAAWASREEEEADASKCLKNIDLEELKKNVVEARASAWEEAEKAKYEARYKREESKIIAWENHEKAKAEAEMRRIEVKVERLRSHSHEQLMNKLAVSHRRAEDLRAAAEARRVEQAAKTAQRAEDIRQTGNMPPPSSSTFSLFLQLGRLCC